MSSAAVALLMSAALSSAVDTANAGPARDPLELRAGDWDSEGHVIRCEVQAPAANRLVFASEAAAGPRSCFPDPRFEARLACFARLGRGVATHCRGMGR